MQKYIHHGMKGTKLYNVWKSMKRRCYNSSYKYYKDYGARGITICDEWLHHFKQFYDWSMNNCYQEGLTIDRIDNDKGYSPDNCRWITNGEQQNNKRNSVRLEYKPDTWLSIREISQIENIKWQKAYKKYVVNEKTRLPRKQLCDSKGDKV